MSVKLIVNAPATSEEKLSVTKTCFQGAGVFGSAAAVTRFLGLEKTSLVLAAGSALAVLAGLFGVFKTIQAQSEELQEKDRVILSLEARALTAETRLMIENADTQAMIGQADTSSVRLRLTSSAHNGETLRGAATHLASLLANNAQ